MFSRQLFELRLGRERCVYARRGSDILDPGSIPPSLPNRFDRLHQVFSEGELVAQTESAPTFSRTFRGYDPAAVDAYVEAMTTKQQLLIDDVESLRARLNECSEEAAALRKEVIVLRDTSPSLHAMQHRMATMLRRAVDEVSEMQAEAQALIAAAKAEAEKLDAELARKRAETQSQLDEALRDAQQEREQLLADAKQEANHYCVICRLKSGRNRF